MGVKTYKHVMKKNFMDEERSAGAVVFYNSKGIIEYLVLHYEEGHWDFPKGHIEEKENVLKAMMREVEEETGLKVNVVFGFNEVTDYVFKAKYDNGRLKHKTVDYFLAEAKTKTVKLSHEHIGYEWLPYEFALERITHSNSRKVLRKAHMFLKSLLKS